MNSQFLLPLSVLWGVVLPQCTTADSPGRDMVTKVAVVRPVESNGEIVSAQVYFPGVPYSEYDPKPEGITPILALGDTPDVPSNWYTERFSNGALRITWTGKRNGKELPVLTEEGFHYVVVPMEAVRVIGDRGRIGAPFTPTIVTMGGNTAYLPKRQRSTP